MERLKKLWETLLLYDQRIGNAYVAAILDGLMWDKMVWVRELLLQLEEVSFLHIPKPVQNNFQEQVHGVVHHPHPRAYIPHLAEQ